MARHFNILLDRLPDNYDGWLIRSDYRIGIQIALCLQDEELTQDERVTQAVWLLFGKSVPPLKAAVQGLEWFMNGGQEQRKDVSVGSSPQRYWFDFDHARIAASFKKSFGIDLHKVNMHWFEFLALIDCLDEDSSFSHAISVRGTDTASMKGKQRRDFDRAKKMLTPPREYTDEEKAVIDAFFAQ